MDQVKKPIFESNGLLDFFPTPPDSTEDVDIQPPAAQFGTGHNRPDQYQYEDDEPPPDFDEEPSDFEDEVQGIMKRENESSSRVFGEMDIDDADEEPVASCEASYLVIDNIS